MTEKIKMRWSKGGGEGKEKLEVKQHKDDKREERRKEQSSG